MRLQYHVSTGGFPTLGENMEDLDAERMRLLTLVLPSYGQAARPLDLFLHTAPEIYDLKVKTDWEQWHVLMLQNWDEWDKTYLIRFTELGLDEKKGYLVFRFWDQMFLGEFRGGVDLKVRMQEVDFSACPVMAVVWRFTRVTPASPKYGRWRTSCLLPKTNK